VSRELAERALRETLDRLEGAGDALRARSVASIAESVGAAWGRIADPERALGRAAREQLPASTGLTLPMVAWALASTFDRAGPEQLASLVRQMEPPEGSIAAPARSSVLVLAGNVFTACVQPWTLSLLARAPVLVKASSKDDTLPRLFHAALAEVDEGLADACGVVTFPGGTPSLEATLLSRADVVSVYGSDATVASIRARLSGGTELVRHGHGLGVGFVGRRALASEETTRAAAAAFALDVAAYDQRGCMSPHAIWVERGAPIDALGLTRALASELERCGKEIPRGALPTEVGAAQLQWRGVAAARGELLEGDGWAVSYEAGAALRVSPGWRNVMVLDAPGPEAFARSLSPLGVHLKALGVAGSAEERRAIALSLPPSLAPRVCAAGEMQRPSLDDLADGRVPWHGLVRFTQVD
jgi:hypothetical protein